MRSSMLSTLARLGCVAAMVAAGLVAAGGSSAGAAPPPSPWLQDGYNAGGTRANVAETRIAKYNLDTLTSRWMVHSFGDDTPPCYGGQIHPAISESHVYSVTQGVLTKQNIKDGSVVWANADPLTTSSGPEYLAVTGGRVVVLLDGCDDASNEQYVVGFDSASGTRVWERTVTAPDSVKVTVSDGKVLLTDGYSGTKSLLRASTGALVWRTTAADEKCIDTPKILDGHLLTQVCSSGSVGVGLRSRSLSDGSVDWTRTGLSTTFGVLAATDSPSGPHAYVSNNATNRTVDIDPRTGATRFSLVGSWGNGPDDIAVDGTRVYTSCDRRDAALCAWDVATGKFRWKLAFPDDYSAEQPLVTGTLLYVGYSSAVVKPDTGQLVKSLGFEVVAAGQGHLVGYDGDYQFHAWATSNVA